MTAPIGVGDFVECVDATTKPGFGPLVGLVVGHVYLVTWVGFSEEPFTDAGAPALQVAGARPTTNERGVPIDKLSPARFRPIYRRDEGLINRLLQPIPAEPEQVSA